MLIQFTLIFMRFFSKSTLKHFLTILTSPFLLCLLLKRTFIIINMIRLHQQTFKHLSTLTNLLIFIMNLSTLIINVSMNYFISLSFKYCLTAVTDLNNLTLFAMSFVLIASHQHDIAFFSLLFKNKMFGIEMFLFQLFSVKTLSAIPTLICFLHCCFHHVS